MYDVAKNTITVVITHTSANFSALPSKRETQPMMATPAGMKNSDMLSSRQSQASPTCQRFQQTRAQQYQQQHHAHDVARKSDRKHACDRASRTVHGNHQGELRGEARSSLARPVPAFARQETSP